MSCEHYIVKDGEKLKKGFTTGSAAAGAAKAAVKILFTDRKLKEVEIATPAGIDLTLKLAEVKIEKNLVRTSVIKDGGDDPDVTDGLEIAAEVEQKEKGIKLIGGLGVGKVMKPGLAVKVGEPAINPVPREMINKEVNKVLPENKGVKITLHVPKGEETAQQTLNPQLGIKGGISILGTTGIVEPMSEQAYKDSLALSIKQAVELGYENLSLVFGNYGQQKANELGFKEEQIIRMSNFVGFMLDKCVKAEIKQVTLIGQIGKLVKVTAGIFNTHSQVADARLETIAAYTASLGANTQVINQILKANTAEEAVQIVYKAGYREVFLLLAERAAERVKNYIDDKLQVETVFFSLEEGILAATNSINAGDRDE